uniref:Ig-like domain-containing protein n=1 Tax=Paramormyrops kingsleyae TaxID=1676925 RepID=A0A3B3S0M8_9TELE
LNKLSFISWDFLHFSLFHTNFPTGHGEGSGVTQNPAILWAPIGNSSQMNCSHNKGIDYSQMYWYHQRPGENMQLIVFTAVGEAYQKNFEITGDGREEASLHIANVTDVHTAVYFCAASTQF